MSKNKKEQNKNNRFEKTAINNQWTNANAEAARHDHRERRDGPGGENGEKEQ